MTERYDMTCDQGATFIREIALTDADGVPVDYTGWSMGMQVRKSHSAKTAAVSFTVANGRVVVQGTLGLFTFRLTDEETSVLIPGTYVYDMMLEDPAGNKDRIIEGRFVITPGVTRVDAP